MTKSILFSSFSAFLAVLGLSCNVWAIDTNSLSHDTTHTLELKPSSLSFQLAKITFLPDAAEDALDFGSAKLPDDYNSDGCENYPLSFCPDGALCEQCPFDVSKYRVYSCVAPYIETNGSCVCPTAVDLNNPNDVCTQYCGDNCIAKTCTPTSNQSGCTNGTQNCDNGCGENTRKCCVPCEHKITSKPANSSYTYASCTDGNGTKQIQTAWTCNSGYHEKNGACEKDCIVNSCSGFTLSSCPTNANCSECTIKAQNCDTDGTKYKITSCKNGAVTSCSGYTLSSCPANGNCSSCKVINSDCSTGSTKYKLTSCKSGYKVSGNSCVKAGVSRACLYIGDLLYHDKTCAGVNDTLDTSKTVIGIVFDTDRKLAIALEESSLTFSSKYKYIYSDKIGFYDFGSTLYDYNGKNNTNIIINESKNNNFEAPAADYCYNYTTIGTQKGDWYLPAIGELHSLNYNSDIHDWNIDILNKSLAKVRGTELHYGNYWSSTKYSSYEFWYLDIGGITDNPTSLYEEHFVRPVIAY